MSKSSKGAKCINDLRHAEYYDMQGVFDDLYRQSMEGSIFTNLMDSILSESNILLAYRNIRSNMGSKTAGTDGKTIKDIARCTPEEVVQNVRYYLTGSVHGYRSKPVRRKDIPKANGKTRSLGIPCIWDRLIQQCIKQILEPIVEARFSDNSYGFRPDRSVENAMASVYRLLQQSHMTYVVEFDIEGFFDNVDHSKLIKQLWSLGIHDKTLLYIIRQMLKAPIKMSDGAIVRSDKGTLQGGILSPLLANVVLNELDQWVDSQWVRHPVTRDYSVFVNKSGSECFSNGYAAMRKKTKLKEIRIIRYADDFRIFCRDYDTAGKIMAATVDWLENRLRLNVSKEKTRIVNVEKNYMEFLGFKMRMRRKVGKMVVESHLSDKALDRVTNDIIEQAKNIAKPRRGRTVRDEVVLYNQMVMGIHNYYEVATDVNIDFQELKDRVQKVFKNRLCSERNTKYVKSGRALTASESKTYGRSNMLRYEAETKEPIYPIGYVQTKTPIHKLYKACRYTEDGRSYIHDNVSVNSSLMHQMAMAPSYGRSAEFMDNRVSLFSAQKGKCAVTGKAFLCVDEIHTHHKMPRVNGGTDCYSNLVLILEEVHRLVHAVDPDVIDKYLAILKLTKKQIAAVNDYRVMVGNQPI